MITPISVLENARRKFGVKTNRPSTAVTSASVGPPYQIAQRLGVGENGNRPALIAPRIGRLLPRRYSTSTITINGTSRSTPGNAVLPDFGNHVCETPEVADQPGLHAEHEGGERRPPERAEAADERGGERGDDQRRQHLRIDGLLDAGREDAEQTGDQRRDDPVGAGEEVGREPEHDRTLLVLRRGAGGETEAGELEDARTG